MVPHLLFGGLKGLHWGMGVKKGLSGVGDVTPIMQHPMAKSMENEVGIELTQWLTGFGVSFVSA